MWAKFSTKDSFLFYFLKPSQEVDVRHRSHCQSPLTRVNVTATTVAHVIQIVTFASVPMATRVNSARNLSNHRRRPASMETARV